MSREIVGLHKGTRITPDKNCIHTELTQNTPQEITLAHVMKCYLASLEDAVVGMQPSFFYCDQHIMRTRATGPLNGRCTVKKLIDVKREFRLEKGYLNDNLFALQVQWTLPEETARLKLKKHKRRACCFFDGSNFVMKRGIMDMCVNQPPTYDAWVKKARLLSGREDKFALATTRRARRQILRSAFKTLRHQSIVGADIEIELARNWCK